MKATWRAKPSWSSEASFLARAMGLLPSRAARILGTRVWEACRGALGRPKPSSTLKASKPTSGPASTADCHLCTHGRLRLVQSCTAWHGRLCVVQCCAAWKNLMCALLCSMGKYLLYNVVQHVTLKVCKTVQSAACVHKLQSCLDDAWYTQRYEASD